LAEKDFESADTLPIPDRGAENIRPGNKGVKNQNCTSQMQLIVAFL
jgi:hypothetical protein